MRNDLTDITLIVDCSGSMIDYLADSEGGINSYIEAQKKAPGECLFTLVEFDTAYKFVYKGVDIQTVPTYTMYPGGYTALRDALGRAIVETGARLAAMPEAERPGLVLFIVVTDGRDNKSLEYSSAAINEMITHQETKYSWKFTYLGANQDAFAAASPLGFSQNNTACYAVKMSHQAYDTVATQTLAMRCPGGPRGPQGSAGFNYSDAERKAMQ